MLFRSPSVNQTSTPTSITLAPALAPAPQLVASASTVGVAGTASSWSNVPSPTAARATSSSGVHMLSSSITLQEIDHRLEAFFRGADPSRLATTSNLRPAPSTHVAHERPLEWTVDEGHRDSDWGEDEPPAEEQSPREWTVHQTVGDDWAAEESRPASATSEHPTFDELYEIRPASAASAHSTADELYDIRPASAASEHPTVDELYEILGLIPGDHSPVPSASPASEHSDQYYEEFEEWPIGAAVECPMSRASGHSTAENQASPPRSHDPLNREEDSEEDASVKMRRFNHLLCELYVIFKIPAHTSHMCLG